MNAFRTCKATPFGWITAVLAVVLFSSTVTLHAADDPPKKPAPKPAAKAPASHPAPAKSAPAPAGQAAHPTGQPAAGGGPGRAGAPAGAPAGAGTQQRPNTAQPGGAGRGGTPGQQPGTAGRGGAPGQPAGVGRGTPNQPANAGREGMAGQTPGGGRGGPSNNAGARPGGGPGPGRFPAKATVYHAPNGGQVHTRADGSIREVRTPGGAVIHHGPGGERRAEVIRPGGRVIVANRAGYGYVQRPIMVRGGRPLVQRTYYVGGVRYAHVYRPYTYGGVVYNVYTPVRYYPAAYYGYVYAPWAQPVPYGWGWGGSPWYGYYGGYFTPYPVYASPSLWLTDYLVAMTLQQAYQERMAAAAANADASVAATPMTPDVKQAIAEEVRRQIDQEKAEQQAAAQNTVPPASGAPPIFSGGSHVFVVSSSLDVDSGGQECSITQGDVLQLAGAIPPNSTAANVVVLASKGQDCRKGSTVAVQVQDLQEMQNQMRTTLDQGLGDLQAKQGQGGLPTLPAAAAAPATDAAFAADIKPDATADADLNQVQQEADRAEQDTVNQAAGPSAGQAGPVTLDLGLPIEDVEATMGQPKTVIDLGDKKIYLYKDMKITFASGKVSDIQ